MDINVRPIIITNIPKIKGFTGRHHSESTKQKISNSKTGVANMKNRKCDQTTIDKIRKERKNGDSITKLSHRYCVSRKTIYAYLYDDKLNQC